MAVVMTKQRRRLSLWQRFFYRLRKDRWGYIFIAPSFLLFSFFFLYPVLSAVRLSFLEYTPVYSSFVGLANYRDTFTDPIFWVALRNNLLYCLGVVPLWLGKALIVSALIYPLSRRWQTLFKSAFYLPHVTSGVIISMIWLWIYNPAFGLLNSVLQSLSIGPVNWLGNTSIALLSIIGMVVIMGGGSSIVLITASMSGIPMAFYEAAALDGAGRWQMFTRITVPLLRPILLYLVVTGTISSFQVFENIFLMTKGGPQFSTTTIVYLIYDTAFQSFNFGKASAQAIVLFVIVFIFGILQFKALSSKVEY